MAVFFSFDWVPRYGFFPGTRVGQEMDKDVVKKIETIFFRVSSQACTGGYCIAR